LIFMDKLDRCVRTPPLRETAFSSSRCPTLSSDLIAYRMSFAPPRFLAGLRFFSLNLWEQGLHFYFSPGVFPLRKFQFFDRSTLFPALIVEVSKPSLTFWRFPPCQPDRNRRWDCPLLAPFWKSGPFLSRASSLFLEVVHLRPS